MFSSPVKIVIIILEIKYADKYSLHYLCSAFGVNV